MNILIAPDKFKDSCSAAEVCEYLSRGILTTFPNANCNLIPLADGGEGTLESIYSVFDAQWKEIITTDPVNREITAKYLYIPSKTMAIIEMARASGIELLKSNERNCMITSSFGTGLLIKNAIEIGAKEIILTVGGTATNDAGMGIATALGFDFYDKNNKKLAPIGQNLIKIDRIDGVEGEKNIKDIKFTIATDVENPFFGNNGAAKVYAKQKGANQDEIEFLDNGLENFAKILNKNTGKNPQNIIGSGAGGGVSGGLACLFDAQIVSAAEWILEINQIKDALKNSQILITGEGKVDSQSWQGKLISRLLKLAKEANVAVIVICGTLEDIDVVAQQDNILYATSILPKPMTLEEALKNTSNLLFSEGLLLGKLLKGLK